MHIFDQTHLLTLIFYLTAVRSTGTYPSFDIINIDYYDAILETPFLRKHVVIIDFMNNCLRLKDKIVRNQTNKYKMGEGNPQKNKKSVSMKALKQEEPTIPHRDSK